MIAVIKGDIVNSRKIRNPEIWLTPLKKLFNKLGKSPRQWIRWGDSLQLEIVEPSDALKVAFEIKALIKSIKFQSDKRFSVIDVRMAIGIGAKEYSGKLISESNGPAFHYSGEIFEKLKKEKRNIAIKSPWKFFDEEINLYLKLAAVIMDNWSVSSSELIKIVFAHPQKTQKEIGDLLKIKQNSVSGRWKRAKVDEIMAVDEMFRKKINKQLRS